MEPWKGCQRCAKSFRSLFIHIMPCVTLHCLVHLLPNIHTISPIPFDIHLPWIPFSMPDFSSFHLPSLSLRSFSLSAFFTPPSASSISGPTFQAIRFPAVHTIATSQAGDANHYTLTQMLLWATIPYAVWQLSYHFLITVRRRDKIAAGEAYQLHVDEEELCEYAAWEDGVAPSCTLDLFPLISFHNALLLLSPFFLLLRPVTQPPSRKRVPTGFSQPHPTLYFRWRTQLTPSHRTPSKNPPSC